MEGLFFFTAVRRRSVKDSRVAPLGATSIPSRPRGYPPQIAAARRRDGHHVQPAPQRPFWRRRRCAPPPPRASAEAPHCDVRPGEPGTIHACRHSACRTANAALAMMKTRFAPHDIFHESMCSCSFKSTGMDQSAETIAPRAGRPAHRLPSGQILAAAHVTNPRRCRDRRHVPQGSNERRARVGRLAHRPGTGRVAPFEPARRRRRERVVSASRRRRILNQHDGVRRARRRPSPDASRTLRAGPTCRFRTSRGRLDTCSSSTSVSAPALKSYSPATPAARIPQPLVLLDQPLVHHQHIQKHRFLRDGHGRDRAMGRRGVFGREAVVIALRGRARPTRSATSRASRTRAPIRSVSGASGTRIRFTLCSRAFSSRLCFASKSWICPR